MVYHNKDFNLFLKAFYFDFFVYVFLMYIQKLYKLLKIVFDFTYILTFWF